VLLNHIGPLQDSASFPLQSRQLPAKILIRSHLVSSRTLRNRFVLIIFCLDHLPSKLKGKRWENHIDMETRSQRGNYKRPNSRMRCLESNWWRIHLIKTLQTAMRHRRTKFSICVFQKVNGCRVSCLMESYQQLGQTLVPCKFGLAVGLYTNLGWSVNDSCTQWLNGNGDPVPTIIPTPLM
jgi:hypothetical protein